MHVRLVIEFGSDALDGPAVLAARSEVMRVVSTGVRMSEDNIGLREGSFSVAVAGSPIPVEVRYRITLLDHAS